MTDKSSSEFGAWTTYFNDIGQFLEGDERQYGIANANFCEYVLERLELSCVQIFMLSAVTSGEEAIIGWMQCLNVKFFCVCKC